VIGGLLRVLVVALVVLVAALMLLPRPGDVASEVAVATVLDVPRELPQVALTDDDGAPFAIGSLAGRPTLVFFGFTNCPDICPLTLAVLAQAMDSLRAEETAPAVLFVSVDPGRDTPARIKAYVEAFDPEFIGATADDATLAPLLAALGVTVHQERQGDAVYNVVHNGTVYVLDADARWAALFGGSAHRTEDIVRDYRALRRRLAGG
jgi:protein SCO1/2